MVDVVEVVFEATVVLVVVEVVLVVAFVVVATVDSTFCPSVVGFRVVRLVLLRVNP